MTTEDKDRCINMYVLISETNIIFKFVAFISHGQKIICVSRDHGSGVYIPWVLWIWVCVPQISQI